MNAVVDHPLYWLWRNMVRRCHQPTQKDFHRYGKRGVRVCARWRDSFAAFVADLGPRPAGAQLDRFPNADGNYEPGNVRWATPKDNARNRRNTTTVLFEGREHPLSALAERFNIDVGGLHKRLNRGWDIATALTQAGLKPYAVTPTGRRAS